MHKAALIFFTLSAVAAQAGTARAATLRDGNLIQHGRYLVQTTGCNDCHTPDYAAAEGRVDEKLWLTGEPAPAYVPPGHKPKGPSIQFPG